MTGTTERDLFDRARRDESSGPCQGRRTRAGYLPTTVQTVVHLDARDLTRRANIELPLYDMGRGL